MISLSAYVYEALTCPGGPLSKMNVRQSSDVHLVIQQAVQEWQANDHPDNRPVPSWPGMQWKPETRQEGAKVAKKKKKDKGKVSDPAKVVPVSDFQDWQATAPAPDTDPGQLPVLKAGQVVVAADPARLTAEVLDEQAQVWRLVAEFLDEFRSQVEALTPVDTPKRVENIAISLLDKTIDGAWDKHQDWKWASKDMAEKLEKKEEENDGN